VTERVEERAAHALEGVSDRAGEGETATPAVGGESDIFFKD